MIPKKKHPWIENEIENAKAKKRLRQQFLNVNTTDAPNRYSSQNKFVKIGSSIEKTKTLSNQNNAFNSRTKHVFEFF